MFTYSPYIGGPDDGNAAEASTGVLLVNLGTPDAPTAPAVRRYLAQFLHDHRVIELSRWKWCPILHGIVLRTRPPRVARAYQRIWREDGSPLLSISRRQANALEAALAKRLSEHVKVALGMSYGNPSIPAAIEQLRTVGVRRILLLPLYPQYSGSTVGSVFDATLAALSRLRRVPELRTVHGYPVEPGYIDALAASVREYRESHGSGDLLLFSFHGVPRRYVDNGDPYYCESIWTAQHVAARLGLADDEWKVTFQSRFGREEWLQPYTDQTLESLGQSGLGRVDVICPGFAADCLETLDEIANENRELFEEAGGESLHYIPALNDRGDHIEALADIVERHMAGWSRAGDELAGSHGAPAA
ncbi:MAG: ferrochelatase [Halofilum sp. (in: g-proteobacteria)]